MKIKRHPNEWLFSGTVSVLYTPMNYQLIKEWGTADMTMDIPTEAFLDKYRKG